MRPHKRGSIDESHHPTVWFEVQHVNKHSTTVGQTETGAIVKSKKQMFIQKVVGAIIVEKGVSKA